jgi:hypothetical protein
VRPPKRDLRVGLEALVNVSRSGDLAVDNGGPHLWSTWHSVVFDETFAGCLKTEQIPDGTFVHEVATMAAGP